MPETKDGLVRCMEYSKGFAAGAGHQGIPPECSKDFIDGYVDGKRAKRSALSLFAARIGYQLKTLSVRGGSEPPEDT